MNTYSMRLSERTTLAVNAPSVGGRARWAMTYGTQHDLGDETRRIVSLSMKSGNLSVDCDYTEYQWASLDMTPDEARGLAARLLDAADDADEQRYTLTAKGEAALA